MSNIFFISDWHIGHQNMCNFTNYDGTKARNFDNYIECDQTILKNWNEMVSPNDVVYYLGDLVYACEKKYGEEILSQLNGTIKMIGGNHDLWSTQWYLRYVKYVRGCSNLDNYFLSHVPIHADSKGRFKLNIHGHIHNQEVMKCVPLNGGVWVTKDPFYFNVCVDYKYRYKPVPFEEIEQYYQQCLDDGLLDPIPPRKRD